MCNANQVVAQFKQLVINNIANDANKGLAL